MPESEQHAFRAVFPNRNSFPYRAKSGNGIRPNMRLKIANNADNSQCDSLSHSGHPETSDLPHNYRDTAPERYGYAQAFDRKRTDTKKRGRICEHRRFCLKKSCVRQNGLTD